MQMVLLERAKPAVLALAVALLEQDAEALCGRWNERKSPGQEHRGAGMSKLLLLWRVPSMGFGDRECGKRIAKSSCQR